MEQNSENSSSKVVGEIVVNLVSAVVIFFLFYFFIAQTHEVHGASMQPNFYTGERVVTEKVTKLINNVNRGDVIVLQTPSHAEPLIKRVVGLPDETIEIVDGRVLINGSLLPEAYLSSGVKTGGQRFLTEGKEYKIPDGEFIVMGDNRGVSSDSRTWGTVKKEDIIGRVVLRYWPLSKLGLIRTR